MKFVLKQIIEELKAPFADPRNFRTLTNKHIDNKKLFYLLIDESEKTFKRGLIVTATVNQVFDNRAVCRLENGLTAIIPANAIQEDSSEKLKDKIEFGCIVTGRIDKINFQDEKNLEVTLQCKAKDVQSHEQYKADLAESLGINPELIPKEDLRNHHFSIDAKPKQ